MNPYFPTPNTPNMTLIPNVIQRTPYGERGLDIISRLLDDRIILLTEDVNPASASIIIAQLLYLDSISDKDIQFYINSPGGSVSDGLAIYDTMQHIKSDVSTICMGMAASMGAILLTGGTKGKRCCLPNAEVMIHQPSGGAQGQATEIEIAAKHIARTKERLTSILAEHTGKSKNAIIKASDRDNWFTAEDALKFGLIDQIITSTPKN